jgi:hypothetical protein
MVVVVKAHLKIESHKLSHVAMSVRILCTENGSDLEHSFKVRTNCHLLIKLRGLSKVSLGCIKSMRGLMGNMKDDYLLPKYCNLKTDAPPSLAAPICRSQIT